MDEKNMNIAMLGHKRIPSREGGIEVVVEELATRMTVKNNSVTCYNRSGHHVSGNEFDSNEINTYKGVELKKVFTIDKKGLAAVTSSFFGAFRAAFGKYDVVHFHAEGPCAMLWLPKLFGKRCIATIHGLDWQRAKWKSGFGSRYIKLGEKIAVKFADEIIVLSKSIQEYFEKTYGRKTVYIPNGVTEPILYEADIIKAKYGLEKDSYILFLGRIVPEKGIKYLIEAFKDLKTDKKLVVAGGASDSEDFYEEIKALAGDNVIFTGFVQGQELSELYSNAYIYVLPSDLEGMPLSLLEAMSYGNCCLVSSINECMEVVEEYGMVFRKSDIYDLKEKLQYLCDKKEVVNNYKLRSKDFICRKYNWDDVTQRTLELYSEG